MELKVVTFLLLVFSAFRAGNFQMPKPGLCSKNIQPISPFNNAKFSGIWHEIKRYPSNVMIGNCVSIKYQYNERGAKISTSQVMPGINTTSSENAIGQGNGKRTVGLFNEFISCYVNKKSVKVRGRTS